MQISSLSEACDFVLEWQGVPGRLPGKPLSGLAAQALPIVELNACLGLVWQSKEHPLKVDLSIPGKPVSVFEYQDRVLNPSDYEIDEQGIVSVVWENQGVWGMGFSPSDPGPLWVKRYWVDNVDALNGELWRRTNSTLDEGLTFALLSNFIIMIADDDEWQADENNVSAETPVLLWRFQSITEGFPSFWTNDSRTAVHYSGMYITVRR